MLRDSHSYVIEKGSIVLLRLWILIVTDRKLFMQSLSNYRTTSHSSIPLAHTSALLFVIAINLREFRKKDTIASISFLSIKYPFTDWINILYNTSNFRMMCIFFLQSLILLLIVNKIYLFYFKNCHIYQFLSYFVTFYKLFVCRGIKLEI